MPLLTLRSSSINCLVVFFFTLFAIAYDVNAQGPGFSVDKTQPGWIVKVDNKTIKLKEKDISDGYYLSLYENQVHAELNEDYTHIIREIASDAGVQNGSQISVTYEPNFQKLVFHKILVWRGNKAIDQLKASKFKVIQNEKDLSKFIYSGTYDAFLILDDVRKGDRIEYAYSVKGSNPIFGKKHSGSYYVEGSSVIGQLYMNLIVGKNRKLNLKSFNKAESPKIREQDGFRIYEWANDLTKTHRYQDFEPSWYNPLKKTQVTEYNSWNEVVNWGLSVNNYSGLKSPLLDKKIQEFRKQAAGNVKKYIELASRFVQDEIRYMGIEMGMYSHRPNSPEKVLKQRYGDCKDKSLLLIHLLEGMNIPAYMVYADTDLTLSVKDYLPSPFVFNHVIVAIDYNNRRTWLDPTVSYQRGKFDDFYAPDYGYVLVIKAGNNALERLVSKPKGKLSADVAFNVADTADNKKSTLVIRSTYSGNYADNIRSEIAESGTDGLEKDFLEYYGEYYTDIESSAPLEVEDNEKTNVVVLTESYEIPNIWVREEDNEKQYVTFYADLIINELRKISSKKRSEPVALKHPVNLEQNITVYLPYMYDEDSEVIKVDNGQYSFELERKNETNTATFNYKYKSLSGYMAADQIKAYNKDYKKVDGNLSYYFMAKGVSPVSTPLNLNRYAVFGFIITVIISGLLFMQVYQQRNTFSVEEMAQAKNISGWLIVLGIYLTLTAIGLFFSLVQSGLFENKLWDQLADSGKFNRVFIGLAFIDLILITALFTYAILCCCLFFNKRESFSKHFIYFCIGDIVISIFHFLVFKSANITLKIANSLSEQIIYLLVSIVICLALIWYIKRSTRVKETFVFTYPESEWRKAMIEYYNRRLTNSNIAIETVNEQVNNADKNDQHENI